MKPQKISAVIICWNEEQNIVRCIQSLLPLTDDIVVVDSGSSDNTVLYARILGARVFEREWTGYADQKNFGNGQALHPYILSLDADECISPELAGSIRSEMDNPGSAVYAFGILGSWAGRFVYRGNWYPGRHCRLFDKRKISWGVDQAAHEALLIDGYSPKRLEGQVYHYPARTRKEYREKKIRSAIAFAHSRKKEQRFSFFWEKYLHTAACFLNGYLFRLGILEGKAGWEIACEEARGAFLKYKWSQPGTTFANVSKAHTLPEFSGPVVPGRFAGREQHSGPFLYSLHCCSR